MGMNVELGKKGRVHPDMNVTPLVDVVLVLLIIFMVLAPVVTKAFLVRVPPTDDKDNNEPASLSDHKPLVLSVDAQGNTDVNGEPIAAGELTERLHRKFNARPDNMLYLNGADEAPYGRVIQVINLARAAGARPLVVLTQELKE